MAKYTDADIQRNKEVMELVRAFKAQQEEEKRRQEELEKALANKRAKKERSKSQPGDPFILWLDKKLDKLRPY